MEKDLNTSGKLPSGSSNDGKEVCPKRKWETRTGNTPNSLCWEREWTSWCTFDMDSNLDSEIPEILKMLGLTWKGIFLIPNDFREAYKADLKGDITHLEFRTSLSLEVRGESEEIIKISSSRAYFLVLSIFRKSFPIWWWVWIRFWMKIWTAWPERHQEPLNSNPSPFWGIARLRGCWCWVWQIHLLCPLL